MVRAVPMTLFWSHTIFAWAIVAYGVRDPLREGDGRGLTPADRASLAIRIAAAGMIVIGASSSLPALYVVALLAVTAAGLTFVRSRIPTRYCAENELTANVIVIAASGAIIRHFGIRADRGIIALPLEQPQIAAVLLVAAVLLFSVHGGTYVVRGILEKSGALPRTIGVAPAEGNVDTKEFNRGRLIGALERVLLAVLVAGGQYAALGFVFAAKGLIRAPQFVENRDLTEYFLIGSLTSVLVAVGAGLLIHAAIVCLW